MSRYVPVIGSVNTSKNVFVFVSCFARSVLPSGAMIETSRLAIVTFVNSQLARCPAVASKVSEPFWPAIGIDWVTAGPPITADPTTSVTEYTWTLRLPVAPALPSTHSV